MRLNPLQHSINLQDFTISLLIIGNSTDLNMNKEFNFKKEEKDFLTQTNMLERLENIGG